ncbi:MAG: TadE/TadG family type IV pilus assembly protein [Bryobacteraceae bacterium]
MRRKRSERGAGLVEFALVALQLMLVLLSLLEFGRMVLVSTSVANAARTGVRYAIVHGSTRTGTGVDGPSSSGSSTNVEDNVRYYAGAGLLDPGRVTVAVAYPDGNNNPGSRVRVTLTYPYDPFTVLPLRVNLASTSEGVISF